MNVAIDFLTDKDEKPRFSRTMICGFCEAEPVGRLVLHVSGDYLQCTVCEQRYWINSPCNCRSLKNLAERCDRSLKRVTAQNTRIKSELGAYVRNDPKRKYRSKSGKR